MNKPREESIFNQLFRKNDTNTVEKLEKGEMIILRNDKISHISACSKRRIKRTESFKVAMSWDCDYSSHRKPLCAGSLWRQSSRYRACTGCGDFCDCPQDVDGFNRSSLKIQREERACTGCVDFYVGDCRERS